MSTYLQTCRSRVASLEVALREIDQSATWLEPQTAPEAGLLSRLLRNHREQTARALREARELETYAVECARLDNVLAELQADIAEALVTEVKCADCGEVVKDEERQFSRECPGCDGVMHAECGVAFRYELCCEHCASRKCSDCGGWLTLNSTIPVDSTGKASAIYTCPACHSEIIYDP